MTARSAVLAAALALAPWPGAAQESARLTLAEAQQLARAANPEFRRTSNDLDVAGSAVRSAWAAFLPNLNASLGFSGGRSTRVTGEDAYGQPVRLDDPRTFTSSSARQGVSTALTLFDGGANLRTLQARRASYAATGAQIEAQAIQLDARVAREYYQAVRALRTIALEEALLASAQDRLRRTEDLLRLAARNREDVLGARADVAQAEQNVHRARGDAEKASITLGTTLGLDPGTRVAVDTLLPHVFDPATLQAEVLVAGALAASPIVRQRESVLLAARHGASAARRRRLPSIVADASYSRSMSLSSYEAIGEFNPRNYGFNFGVGLSLPLFTRNQTSEAVAQADAAAEDAAYDVRAARLAVDRDVRAALIDLENAYRTLRLAEQQVALNRERLELTQERYRLGGSDFTTLQNIIDRTAQAERQAVEALFGFVNARIGLEERLGRRLED